MEVDTFRNSVTKLIDEHVKKVQPSDLVACKLPLVNYACEYFLRTFVAADASTIPIHVLFPNVSSTTESTGIFPLWRLVASDQRELWELLDTPEAVMQRLWSAPHLRGLVSTWNEQQAVKMCLQWIDRVVAITCPQDSATLRATLRSATATHASIFIRPPATFPSTSSSVASRPVIDSSSSMSFDASACTRIRIQPMEVDKRCANPDSTGEEQEEASKQSVLAEGCLRAAAPVPAFEPLLSIPLNAMFMVSTLPGRCVLHDALRSTRLLEAFPDESTQLVLCLVFEAFVLGPRHSCWRSLLEGIPPVYPSVPLYWDFATELAYLEPSNLVDEVLEKRTALQDFCDQVCSIFEDHDRREMIVSWCQAQLSTNSSCGATYSSQALQLTIDTFSDRGSASVWQERVFTFDNFRWAQATFDSRAFNLNHRGQVVLAMSPVADMLNHALHTDVLTREIQGDAFILSVGAGITDEDVASERELWMSYGPLQSWELLMSYGFIFRETDLPNENDRIPLLLQLDVDPSRVVLGDDEEDDGNAAEKLKVLREYARRRKALIERYHLDLPSSSAANFWIGSSGTPCPALLALLRLQLAEIEEFDMLDDDADDVSSAPSYRVFSSSCRSLDIRVLGTLRQLLKGLLDEMSSSVDEDNDMLATKCDRFAASRHIDNDNDDDDEDCTDGDEADDDETAVPLSENACLAIRLRRDFKLLLLRALGWCSAESERLVGS